MTLKRTQILLTSWHNGNRIEVADEVLRLPPAELAGFCFDFARRFKSSIDRSALLVLLDARAPLSIR